MLFPKKYQDIEISINTITKYWKSAGGLIDPQWTVIVIIEITAALFFYKSINS